VSLCLPCLPAGRFVLFAVKKINCNQNIFLKISLKPDSMGLIKIENMEFYSFHGHFKEERIVGNKFLVDLTIETDMKIPSASDNLKDAVNYQRVYEIVKSQM
jgi:hypothetical protein